MKDEGRVESLRTRLCNLSRANWETFDFLHSRCGEERFHHQQHGNRPKELLQETDYLIKSEA